MTSKGSISVSLIVPAYNEEAIIAKTLQALADYYKKNQKFLGPTELVVVAAGTDNTAKIAKTFKKDFAHMKVVEPKTRVGKGRDVRLGFEVAQGEVQIFMDADLATPVHHIKETVKKLRSNSDVVIGSRKLSKIHPSKLRATFSLLSNLVTRLLFFPRIRDTQCGYKGFTKDAAKKAFKRQRLNGWGFDIELLQLAKENKLKISQQKVDDWDEGPEDMRGDNLLAAYLKTFGDVVLLRVEAWARFASRHYRLFVGLAMVIVFWIAMYIGLKQSVWFDEGYSILLAKRPISELISLTAVDAHPPLYYLVLKGWASIFGYSELALRALSAVLGALSVGAMFFLLKKMFTKAAAVISLPFLVLAPFLMRYNFEIRMYSLVMLLVITATYLMLRARESDKALDWLVYGLVVAVGMYTLYMSAVVWLAHGLYLAYGSFKSGRPLLKEKSKYAYIFTFALFLPYVPTMISQFQHSALPNITSRVGFNELVTTLSFGMLYQPSWQVSAALSILLFVFLVTIIKQISANLRSARSKERDSLSLVLAIFLTPIAFLALISLVRPYFLERYLVHYIIFAYALIGLTLDSAWRKNRHVGAIVLAVSAVGLLLVGTHTVNQKGNFNFQSLNQPSSKFIREEINCEDSTVVAEDPFAYIDSFYYYEGCDLRFFNQDELGAYGGYVPLRFSPSRVDSTLQVNQPTVYHLHWEAEPKFKLQDDERYELVRSTRIDKHFLDEYRLKDFI